MGPAVFLVCGRTIFACFSTVLKTIYAVMLHEFLAQTCSYMRFEQCMSQMMSILPSSV